MNLYNEIKNAIQIVKDKRESFLIRSLAHEDLVKIKKILDAELKPSIVAMEKNET